MEITPPSFYSCSAALGTLPPVGSLQGVRLLSDPSPSATPPTTTTTPFTNTSDGYVMIGAGLPPVPAKLVSKIEAGEYVDMTELLPDRLGICKSTSTDNSFKGSRQKKKALSGILEYVQCFWL